MLNPNANENNPVKHIQKNLLIGQGCALQDAGVSIEDPGPYSQYFIFFVSY